MEESENPFRLIFPDDEGGHVGYVVSKEGAVLGHVVDAPTGGWDACALTPPYRRLGNARVPYAAARIVWLYATTAKGE